MSAPQIMLGMTLPDVDVWSDRVTVALGQNPSAFAGPGTNTYLVGTGPERMLIDPGEGKDSYLDILKDGMKAAGCERIGAIVLTHGHPDHIGGVRSVMERFGRVPVWKFAYEPFDDGYADLELIDLGDGDRVETEGATLRALHTPGHAPDHLCFVLEEERSLFSGDNVLGVGTTVIPASSGDLGQYMASLERLLGEEPTAIYPAHGPKIEDAPGKIREYIAHRNSREEQVLVELAKGPRTPMEMVQVIYAAYPENLHGAACQSVSQHLMKLERDGRAQRAGKDPVQATWSAI
jgi:glyoxylase-like metal-dependent hydrolase (beta-lactamase superfamily II)